MWLQVTYLLNIDLYVNNLNKKNIKQVAKRMEQTKMGQTLQGKIMGWVGRSWEKDRNGGRAGKGKIEDRVEKGREV